MQVVMQVVIQAETLWAGRTWAVVHIRQDTTPMADTAVDTVAHMAVDTELVSGVTLDSAGEVALVLTPVSVATARITVIVDLNLDTLVLVIRILVIRTPTTRHGHLSTTPLRIPVVMHLHST